MFTDNIDNPTIVLIWSKIEIIWVFGKTENLQMFNKDLMEFVSNQLCLDATCISFFPESYWLGLSNQIIEDNYLLKCFRWTSEFNQEFYQKFKKHFCKELPSDYKLCRITKEILESKLNNDLIDDVLDNWENIDDFLNRGFGFCVLKESKVLSSALSCWIADNYYELSINTFDEQARNKNFATICAIGYIDYCLVNTDFHINLTTLNYDVEAP